MIKQNIEEVKKICEDFNSDNKYISHLNVIIDNHTSFSVIKSKDVKINYDTWIIPSLEVKYKDTIINQIFDFDYIEIMKI